MVGRTENGEREQQKETAAVYRGQDQVKQCQRQPGQGGDAPNPMAGRQGNVSPVEHGSESGPRSVADPDRPGGCAA